MIEMMFVDLVYKQNYRTFDNRAFYDKALELQAQNKIKTNWLCDTYNSIGTYDMTKDVLFEKFINECRLNVDKFAREYVDDINNIKIESAWLNVAEPGDYQEYHIHPNSHFSLVYYVNVDDNSGAINFQSHDYLKDMFIMNTGKVKTANRQIGRAHV